MAERYEVLDGAGSGRVVDATRVLAVALTLQEKTEEAGEAFALAVASVRAMPDPPLRVFMRTMLNDAVLLSDHERVDEAIPIVEDCFERVRSEAGDDHPELLWIEIAFSRSAFDAGRLDEAERYARAALRRIEGAGGGGLRRDARTVDSIGRVLTRIGRASLADGRRDHASEVLALAELEEKEPRLHQLILLRFFAGLTIPQAAFAMGVSERTLERDWKLARIRIAERLGEVDEPPER